MEFERTEEFNRRLEVRYRIEEKSGELKQAHGLKKADSISSLTVKRLKSEYLKPLTRMNSGLFKLQDNFSLKNVGQTF